MNTIATRCFHLPALVIALVCHVAAATAQGGSSLDRLDSLVSKQQYREALSALERDPSSASNKIGWLRRHAEQGHVPIMYELSARLFPTDLNESLKWYARGRLARTLDAAECAQPTVSYGWRVNLDRQVNAVADAGVAHAQVFSDAIQEALAWDEQRSRRPPAAWVCGLPENGERTLLPQPKRDAERADTRETMSLQANAVSAFYKAVEAGAEVNFRRLDSGIDVPDGLRRTPAAWLDNRRLLFAGRQPNDADRRTRSPTFPDLYLWDTDKNQATLIRTEAAIYDICANGDNVLVSYSKVGSRDQPWLAAGRFPDLADRPINDSEMSHLFRRPDCEAVQDDPRIPYGANVYWLRSEDGFLIRENRGFTFYRADGAVVPLDVGNEIPPLNGYAPFARAYLLIGGSRDRNSGAMKTSDAAKPGDSIVLFWLHPNGAITSIELPHGVWNRASGERYTAIKPGILLTGGWSDNEKVAGFAGLFLFDNHRITRQIATGPSAVLAVSPDGCRVAFANAPYRSAAMTMSLIDVCSKQ